MRLSKFLSIITFLTFFSLLYVWQQTEILRLAYMGQKKLAVFEDLLDKNSILRYNVGKRASLVQIGDKISKAADFQMPDSYRLVILARSPERLRASAPGLKKESVISRLFGIKRQAEAKTINP